MTRHLMKALAGMAVLTLAVSAAWAQGRGGWRSGTRGRWANVSQEDRQKVADLHQKIREAQWALWTLQQNGADEQQIEQKQAEIAQLRDQLHKLMIELPAGPGLQAGRQGAGPGFGYGYGAGRGWMGRRGGRGFGGGRGICPWLQQPAAPVTQPAN